jgi:hypothetical protein
MHMLSPPSKRGDGEAVWYKNRKLPTFNVNHGKMDSMNKKYLDMCLDYDALIKYYVHCMAVLLKTSRIYTYM